LPCKKKLNALRIYDRIEQLRAEGKGVRGKGVNRGLFEKVAAEFRIGRSQVEGLYYDHRDSVREATEAVQEKLKSGQYKIIP
jgi:hypothetical protein